MFSDVLLTVDFDRTLTGPDSKIPQRNIEAIEYFMQNGGAFTVNTGRSIATFGKYLDAIPHNAPFLLYNGSAAYDNGQLTQLIPIDLDVWDTMAKVKALVPALNLEIQGTTYHHLIEPSEKLIALYDKLGWQYKIAQWGEDVGAFIKFAIFGNPETASLAPLFEGTEEELALFAQTEEKLKQLLGDKVEVFRAAPRIIDVQPRGVSKLAAARRLQKTMERKWLVCVGDAENDIPMLDGADYAYCPADGVVAERYETVCPCGDGAVADVIYKKIPEILQIQP